MMCMENVGGKNEESYKRNNTFLCFWHSLLHIPTPCPCVIPERLMDEKDNC